MGNFIFSFRFWCSAILLSAAFMAWRGRDTMNPDGLNYLDMANASLVDGPAEIINGIRSPGYPALLALVIGIFRPSRANVDPLIHTVNFFLLVLCLVAFVYFLKGFLTVRRGKGWRPGDGGYLVPIGFGFYSLVVLDFIGMAPVVPDMMVATSVFWAAGLCVRLGSDQRDVARSILLGVALGIGYFAKEPLFGLGILLLALLAIFPPSPKFNRRSLWVALLAFLSFVVPLITAKSMKFGHFSTGEAGKYMYLTEVDHIQNFGLDGSFGVMRHSPRVIQEDPLTLDMDLPRPVSFPFFYDNSYWMDGAKVKLDLIQNLRLLKKTLLVDGIVLMYTSWFWFGVLVLAFSVSWKGFPGYFRARDLWLPIWTLAAFGMYSMIHVEYRYLAPFFVLFGLFLYQELAIRAEVMVARPVLRALSLVLLLLLPLPAAKWAFKEGGGNRHARMSRELTAMGLGPGDRLAVVGHDYDLYFVFLMGGRLTAKIMDVDSFWKLEPPGLRVLGDRLRSTGVKALLAYGIPPSPNGALWRDIEGSGPDGTHVLLLEDIRKNAP